MMPGNRSAASRQGANSCGMMFMPKDEARLIPFNSPKGGFFVDHIE